MRDLLRRLRAEWRLTATAREERRRDARGLPTTDPGIERFVDEGIEWLGRAQDNARTRDGGVSRDYSLLRGWNSSYPETTGYIVPTLLDYARLRGVDEPRQRARRMLDWFVRIQLPGGGFQGGLVDATPVVPVTFNTGQILLGLVAGVVAFDAYRDTAIDAADFLAHSLDPDGCWRRHPTPFARPGEKAYETHVSWGLLEAERVFPERGYGEAALRQVRWAITHQQPNGWVARCCLNDPRHPLTHTLGYFLRGVVEAFRWSEDEVFLAAARRTADGLLGCIDDEGRLPGRLDRNWRAVVDWVCLTGSVQIAHSWLLLYRYTADTAYRDAAYRANRYVRRSMHVDGDPARRGGIKGAFPVDGGYGGYEFLNWAVKFAIDANLLEQAIRDGAGGV